MTKLQKIFVPISLFLALPMFTFFLGLINLTSDVAVGVGVLGAFGLIAVVIYDFYVGIKWIINKFSEQMEKK